MKKDNGVLTLNQIPPLKLKVNNLKIKGKLYFTFPFYALKMYVEMSCGCKIFYD
jgi:hypothetical protein